MSDEIVPASEIDKIVVAAFGPTLSAGGFDHVPPRKWVCSRFAPLRSVFEIVSLKGGVVSPRWGFSLDFVPHVSGSSLRWHRTSKSAILDLCFDPIDESRLLPERPYISWLHGSAQAIAMATRVAERELPLARGFWQRAHAIADLPPVFESLKARPVLRFGFYNYFQHPLAYAFTLARLGHPGAACSEFQRYTALELCPERALEKLVALFEREIHAGGAA